MENVVACLISLVYLVCVGFDLLFLQSRSAMKLCPGACGDCSRSTPPNAVIGRGAITRHDLMNFLSVLIFVMSFLHYTPLSPMYPDSF